MPCRPCHGPARLFLALALLLVGVAAPAAAEDAQIAKNRAAERKDFSDRDIIEGFLKVAIGAELHTAGNVDRIRKYDGPIRVYVDNRVRRNRTADVARVVADIRERVANLDIAMTEARASAQIVITLVRDRDLGRTLQKFFGRERARSIQRSLEPQCLSGFRKDETFRIQHSDVIIVADAGEFIFYDCLYEELLQSLGPINDTDSVPWTMFNDDVQMGFFDLYDQHLLNILYHPRVLPGMTHAAVRALLPEILPEVKAFVSKVNGIAPLGGPAPAGRR
jgi:hypothetical protein